MKVLFLDVDGVLNHEAVYLEGGTHPRLDAACLARLKRVLEITGAVIVLSSSWRFYIADRHLAPAFDWAGIPRWIDVTPRAPDGHRGTEVAAWLREHQLRERVAVERYAIIDDDSDFLPSQQSQFVHTSFREGGLTDAMADRLIEILGGAVGAEPARPICSPSDAPRAGSNARVEEGIA